MSFDKVYKKRKDWRKEYFNSMRFDRSCRPHKGCPYCLKNRLYSMSLRRLSAIVQEKELKEWRDFDENEWKEWTGFGNEFDEKDWT